MAHPVIMPKQGLQMQEGYITAWLKQEGESVREGEPLFEMETDKLSIVIDAPASGVLLKIVRPQGETVPITEVIAYIGEADEEVPDMQSSSGAEEKATPAEVTQVTPAHPGQALDADALIQTTSDRVFSTPRARMRAQEKGLDVSGISGSGPEGLIIERDVLAFDGSGQAAASPLARKLAQLSAVDLSGIPGSGDRGKVMARDVRGALQASESTLVAGTTADSPAAMDGMRRAIATKMKASLDSQAQANHRLEVDMTECVRLRQQLKTRDQVVGFTDIVLLACARALREHPGINVMRDGNNMVYKGSVSIGMAVATDRGLLVPVVAQADTKRLQQLSALTRDLAQRARNGQLKPDEMTGGTFTVTNLGMYGIDSFTAICNAPESAILAVGAIKKKAIVMQDGSIQAREMMWLSLTYDHCLIDGAPAAAFLQRVGELLEAPVLML